MAGGAISGAFEEEGVVVRRVFGRILLAATGRAGLVGCVAVVEAMVMGDVATSTVLVWT